MLTYPGDGLDLESRSYSDTISEQVVILMEVSRTLAATCIVAQKQGGGIPVSLTNELPEDAFQQGGTSASSTGDTRGRFASNRGYFSNINKRETG